MQTQERGVHVVGEKKGVREVPGWNSSKNAGSVATNLMREKKNDGKYPGGGGRREGIP